MARKMFTGHLGAAIFIDTTARKQKKFFYLKKKEKQKLKMGFFE
jgi:hypothetical protein